MTRKRIRVTPDPVEAAVLVNGQERSGPTDDRWELGVSGWGNRRRAGEGPKGWVCGGQGERETCEREEAEGTGVGKCGLGRRAKEMLFFFIVANAESESLTQVWGSRISVVCLCPSGCLCDLRTREF